MRSSRQLVGRVVAVLLGLIGLSLLIAPLVDAGSADSGDRVLLPVVGVLMLGAAAARALARRPGLVLGARSLVYRGWSVDSELAWQEVSSVHYETTDPRRARVVVSGRPGASSWRVASHRLLLPLDQVPGRPEIAVLGAALDEPGRVQALIFRLVAASPTEQAAYLDRAGVAFLTGEMGSPPGA